MYAQDMHKMLALPYGTAETGPMIAGRPKSVKGCVGRKSANWGFTPMGPTPGPPPPGGMPTRARSVPAWRGLGALAAGWVLAANLFFFAAVKRIEAAPAAVAATIEPVVGTALALLVFHQQLSPLGWLGLTMVVAGVAAGYLQEAKPTQP